MMAAIKVVILASNTVIFALARTVGWVAHWNEMIEDKNFRIGRPRQLYTGKNKTKYQDIKDR